MFYWYTDCLRAYQVSDSLDILLMNAVNCSSKHQVRSTNKWGYDDAILTCKSRWRPQSRPRLQRAGLQWT